MMDKKKKNNILLMGTSEFAVLSFENIIKANEFNLKGIVTQPDKKSGRGNKITHSPIKKLALKNKIKLYQPECLKKENLILKIKEMNLDTILVAAYGKIVPKNILCLPKYGCINIHPSLLPRYRGPAPIQNAIINGDKYTGITFIQMDEKMDEGDILYQKKIKIDASENVSDLHDKLAKESAQIIKKIIINWLNNKIVPKKQDVKGATYTSMLKKSDGLINWHNEPEVIINQHRAYHPWPGAYTYLEDKGQKIALKLIEIEKTNYNKLVKPGNIFSYKQKLLVATNSKNCILLKRVQLAGKRIITGREFISGYKKYLTNY